MAASAPIHAFQEFQFILPVLCTRFFKATCCFPKKTIVKKKRQQWKRNKSCQNDYHQSMQRNKMTPNLNSNLLFSSTPVQYITDWGILMHKIIVKIKIFYLCEETPPWPVPKFEICSTVSLYDTNSTLLLCATVESSGNERNPFTNFSPDDPHPLPPTFWFFWLHPQNFWKTILLVHLIFTQFYSTRTVTNKTTTCGLLCLLLMYMFPFWMFFVVLHINRLIVIKLFK